MGMVSRTCSYCHGSGLAYPKGMCPYCLGTAHEQVWEDDPPIGKELIGQPVEDRDLLVLGPVRRLRFGNAPQARNLCLGRSPRSIQASVQIVDDDLIKSL